LLSRKASGETVYASAARPEAQFLCSGQDDGRYCCICQRSHAFPGLTPVERVAFHGIQTANLAVLRGGWPDFLVQDPLTRRILAVEVKSQTDVVSDTQSAMHTMLAEAGIPVVVMRFEGELLPEEAKKRAAYIGEQLRALFSNPADAEAVVARARAGVAAMRRVVDDIDEQSLAGGGTA
jgi:hypothetical protein